MPICWKSIGEFWQQVARGNRRTIHRHPREWGWIPLESLRSSSAHSGWKECDHHHAITPDNHCDIKTTRERTAITVATVPCQQLYRAMLDQQVVLRATCVLKPRFIKQEAENYGLDVGEFMDKSFERHAQRATSET